MGSARRLKSIMAYKGVTAVSLAETLGKATQTFYNMLQRDVMKYSEVEKIADALGCDVVFKDRETGKEF